ncbi:GGDEF domain-containing protein, partial [Oceanospirillum sp. HFRX-1_2]
GALTYLEQQSGEGQAPHLGKARYQELHTIHKAVNNLGETLSKLHEMATRDSLTGCVNRGYFMELARQALSDAHRSRTALALVMLDVDHFKKVNDQYGHAVGDDTLKLTTKWIRSALPDNAFIGRLGGEEFAMILPGYDADQAVRLSDKIRLMIANNSIDSGTIPALTVSLGVEVIKSATDEVDKLLSQADKALYQAKASGRNRVVLFQAIEDRKSGVLDTEESESRQPDLLAPDTSLQKTASRKADTEGMHVTASGVITNFPTEDTKPQASKSL